MADVALGTRAEGQQAPIILVVDDDPLNRELLKDTLGHTGYRLLEAADGQTALSLAVREDPDLILLDIIMPGMSGFEVCQWLRQNPSTHEIPVIFLSSLDDLQDRVRGLERGAVDYISKPFRLEEVLARVNTHLTISKLSKEVKQQRDVLERELQQVADTQRSLLLKNLPEISGFQLAVFYETSRYAGGDLFEVIPLTEDRWGILIADAEGHSTPAAVLMAICLTLMRSFPGDAGNPPAVLEYLNHYLCRLSGSRMLTAIYAVYSSRQRRMQFSLAGHLPPMLYRPTTGQVMEISCEGVIPLGLSSLDAAAVPVQEVPLHSGDRLLFYTDGLVERFDPEGKMYGTERLKAQLAAGKEQPPEEALRQISSDVDHFAAGRPADDDQTMLLAIVD